MKNYKLYINGKWTDATSAETDDIINPTTEEIVGTVQNATAEDATKALEVAEKAQKEWRKLPAKTRADKLRAFTAEIRKNKDRLAKLITSEQGKLLKVAQFEVEVTCSFIEYACEWARQIEGALHSRFDNAGQVCTCNERMYVHESIYDTFMDKFLRKVKTMKLADPMEKDADIGPLTNKAGVERMEKMIAETVSEGGKVLIGGKKPSGGQFDKGYWFEPTIIGNCTQNMTIVKEEIFGPVLPVIKFKTFEEVIGYANDCEFGLAAMVFTNDINKIMRLNNELEFGEIYINRGHGEQHQGFHNGLKLSGTGGEDGKYGIEQYLDKKTSYVKFSIKTQ